MLLAYNTEQICLPLYKCISPSVDTLRVLEEYLWKQARGFPVKDQQQP